MKQQINLYRPELRPRKLPFSARFTAGLGLGVLLVCALFSAYAQWQLDRATEARGRAQAELAEWESRSLQLQQQLATISGDQSLDRDILQSQQRVAAMRRVLSYLDQAQVRPDHGYAEYLAGLARRTRPGVWLTRVGISGNGHALEIDGAAIRPALLPEFIESLGQEAAYRDREFRNLRIQRPPGASDQVRFHLSTSEARQP